MGKLYYLQNPRSERIVTLYTGGLDGEEVAGLVGCDSETVYRTLRLLGIPRRRGSGRPRKLRIDDEVAIARLYRSGLEYAELAQRFDCCKELIGQILRRQGVPRRRPGDRQRKWKTGRAPTRAGYVWVYVTPDHPFWCMRAEGGRGRVLEHRLVMAETLGRPLTREETVHHINGNRADNRRENLQLRSGSHGRGVVHRCADCGSTNVIAEAVAVTEKGGQ